MLKKKTSANEPGRVLATSPASRTYSSAKTRLIASQQPIIEATNAGQDKLTAK